MVVVGPADRLLGDAREPVECADRAHRLVEHHVARAGRHPDQQIVLRGRHQEAVGSGQRLVEGVDPGRHPVGHQAPPQLGPEPDHHVAALPGHHAAGDLGDRGEEVVRTRCRRHEVELEIGLGGRAEGEDARLWQDETGHGQQPATPWHHRRVAEPESYRDAGRVGLGLGARPGTSRRGRRCGCLSTRCRPSPASYPYGMHSGIGGLAHVLSEIRLTRDLTPVRERAQRRDLRHRRYAGSPRRREYDYFDGLVSTIGILSALDAPGADLAVARLLELATPDGWQTSWLELARAKPEGRCNDATLGTASVLLGALWARSVRRASGGRPGRPHHRPAPVRGRGTRHRRLLALRPRCVSCSRRTCRCRTGRTDRPASPAPSRRRASPLGDPIWWRRPRAEPSTSLSLGDTSDGGLRLQHRIPGQEGLDTFTYTWCHGPAGTSLLFAALDRAGVPAVAGRTPYDWERACLHSLRPPASPSVATPVSGTTTDAAAVRRESATWCSTSGSGTATTTTSPSRSPSPTRSPTARSATATATYWRFVEHRNDDPLLPPGVGWMQGAAGIAAYLFRLARVLEQGRDAPAVARMDTWWALP